MKIFLPTPGWYVKLTTEVFDEGSPISLDVIEKFSHGLIEDEYPDDQKCGEPPIDADALEPVGHRVEQIGDHHPGNEWQQDLAEKPQQQDDDDKGCEPERQLPLEAHETSVPEMGQSVAFM